MRAVLVIAWKDLKQRLRDRSAIVSGFVAPLVLAFIVSAAFGGGFTGSFHADYVVLDQDNSPLSKAFTVQVLKAPQLREQITVGEARSADEARRLVGGGFLGAAFVIPKGFEANVLANRRAAITVLRSAERVIASDVAEALADAYTSQINAARLSVFTAVRTTQQSTGVAPDPAKIAEFGRAAATKRLPVELKDGRIGVRDVNGANYFGPAMAVFSLFFTTAFVARSMIAERQTGTMPRILASPIPRPALVLGKSATAFVLGIASFAVMFTVLALVLHVQWGDPLAIAVLTVITVLAVMGLMTVLQSFARTQESADALASTTTIVFAVLGGSFFPLFQMPKAIQAIASLTPNGWALKGYTDIAYDGAKLGDLGTHLLAIGGFAVVTCALGMWRSRKLT